MKQLPPGPRGLDLARAIRKRKSNAIKSFAVMFDQYGPRVSLKLGRERLCFLNDPDDVRRVFQQPGKTYEKGAEVEILKPLMGKGLFTNTGEDWKKQRQLAQPTFHKDRIPIFADYIREITRDTINNWTPLAEKGDIANVSTDMMNLALRIVLKSLFGAETPQEDIEQVRLAFAETIRHSERRGTSLLRALDFVPLVGRYKVGQKLIDHVPTPAQVRFRKSLEVLDTIVYRIISRRRKQEGDQTDLLKLYLQSGLGDLQLRDEIVTLLIAGHETTAITLAWSFNLLCDHPGWEERAADPDVAVRIFRETLRIYPPLWRMARVAQEDTELGEHFIPKNTILVAAPYLIHRLPEYWTRPDDFDPDRFLPENEKGRPTSVYFPFGLGPRTCIGNHFALMEGQIVISMIMEQFRLEQISSDPVGINPGVTLRPDRDIRLRIHLRK